MKARCASLIASELTTPPAIADIFISPQPAWQERRCRMLGSTTLRRAIRWQTMAANTTNRAGSGDLVGLVVDDDALVRETVAEVLEDVFDRVYRASDGVAGLEVLHQHPEISLIVTDIAMPRLDGLAFASQARHLHPDLKVLFVSGLQQPPPAEGFLAKPFPARALVSAVQQLLGAS